MTAASLIHRIDSKDVDSFVHTLHTAIEANAARQRRRNSRINALNTLLPITSDLRNEYPIGSYESVFARIFSITDALINRYSVRRVNHSARDEPSRLVTNRRVIFRVPADKWFIRFVKIPELPAHADQRSPPALIGFTNMCRSYARTTGYRESVGTAAMKMVF